jgi:hypothetical protein
MFEHRDDSGKFFTYELDASDFELHEGDTLAPGPSVLPSDSDAAKIND